MARKTLLKNMRDSYNSFKQIGKNSVTASRISSDVMRPSWDVNENLTKDKIKNLNTIAKSIFENHNTPISLDSKIKNPKNNQRQIKLKNSNLSAFGVFHSSDEFRAKFKSYYKGTAIECSFDEVIKWMQPQKFENNSRVGYITGNISEGKSTLITNLCEYLNSILKISIRQHAANYVLPLYVNFNSLTIKEDQEQELPTAEDVAKEISWKIIKRFEPDFLGTKNELIIAKAFEIINKPNLNRIVIFLDSLDILYYKVVMEELLASEEESFDPKKYDIYLHNFTRELIQIFSEDGGSSKIDFIFSIRAETIKRINTFITGSDSDFKYLAPNNGCLVIRLSEEKNEWKYDSRIKEIIKGRLEVFSILSNIPPKGIESINSYIHRIENEEFFLNELSDSMNYGMGLNGNRDLIHKLRSIGWSVYDQRFARIFNDSNMSLLHYMLNEYLEFSQTDKHMMNIFVNWNQSRRNSRIGEYGLPIPMKWRKHHLPSFWLKYLIIHLLDKSPYLDKYYIEGIFSRNEENNQTGYEKHLVQLVLYSLQETTHGRFIKKDDSREESQTKLKLTDRGSRFVKKDVSFNFIYLSLVCRDTTMALPACFDYIDWCDEPLNNSFLYKRNDDEFKSGLISYVEKSTTIVLTFLDLLETSLKYESKAYKEVFNRLRKTSNFEIPNFKVIRKDVKTQILELHRKYGGEETKNTRDT